MKEIILSIGFALGLVLAATTANATNTTSCEHSAQQNQYHCTLPDGSTKVYTSASADAEAVANAVQAQWQAQNQSQTATGGNASATGGSANNSNSISISNPKQPRVTGNVSLGVSANITLFGGVQTQNDLSVAAALRSAGHSCDADAVLYNSPSAKRAGLSAPDCNAAHVCYFSKEDGMVHISAGTDLAACKRSLGID